MDTLSYSRAGGENLSEPGTAFQRQANTLPLRGKDNLTNPDSRRITKIGKSTVLFLSMDE